MLRSRLLPTCWLWQATTHQELGGLLTVGRGEHGTRLGNGSRMTISVEGLRMRSSEMVKGLGYTQIVVDYILDIQGRGVRGFSDIPNEIFESDADSKYINVT